MLFLRAGFSLNWNKMGKEGEQEKTFHGRPMGISHVAPVRHWWRDIPLRLQCSQTTCGGWGSGGWWGVAGFAEQESGLGIEGALVGT